MEVNKFRIKVVIVFLSFCQALQFSISPILYKLQIAYPEASVNSIQLLVTSPMLMATLVAVASGWLANKVNKKTLLIVASVICCLSGMLPLVGGYFELLFISRLLLGVGLGLVTVLNTAVIAEHFQGNEKISVMGLQGASVGVGMVIITTLSGYLGAIDFRYVYFIHLIGIVALIVVIKYLPKTNIILPNKKSKIRMNKHVYILAFFTFIEFVFIISFSTNIAMHISKSQVDNSVLVGIIIGIFSAVQIVAGLFLEKISRFTKENTLLIAMIGFSIGAFLIVISSGNLSLLMLGAIFIGLSQGVFTPRVLFEATSLVEPPAIAMAAAIITIAICCGQLFSPIILNSIADIAWGKATTSSVFLLGVITMFLLPTLTLLLRGFKIRKTRF